MQAVGVRSKVNHICCFLTFCVISLASEKSSPVDDPNSLDAKDESVVCSPFSNEQLAGLDSLVIPLKRAGRLILLEAVIDGESGNLVFDSGATGLVLNRTYFRNHVSGSSQSSKGITGSVGSVDEIAVDNLKISDLSFSGVSAHMADLGHIENRRGVKVLGLFGFHQLKNFELFLDYPNGALHLTRIDKKGNRLKELKNGFHPDCILKIEVFNNVVFVKGTIAGKVLRFCLDTGAETNAISSDAAKAVLKTITITRKSTLRGSGSLQSEVLYGTMDDFAVENIPIPGMLTVITNLDHLSEAYGVHIDGVLGYEFLSKGQFCINFEKKLMEISFTKPENNQ